MMTQRLAKYRGSGLLRVVIPNATNEEREAYKKMKKEVNRKRRNKKNSRP